MSISGVIGLPFGGGNAFSLFKKSTDGTDAIFANNAARDTYFSANADDLAFLDNNQFKVIRVNDGGSGHVVYQQRLTISGTTSWYEVTGILEGIPGRNGIDGTALEFSTAAQRDTFFNTNRRLLRENLPILVYMGDGKITLQYWRGEANPSSYSSTLWYSGSIQSGVSSFDLGDVHTMSSGGENVFFTNNVNDVNFFPVWQFVGDHRQEAGRVVSDSATFREYGPLLNVEPFGSAASTGAIPYSLDYTATENTSFFGISTVIAETYNGAAIYTATADSGEEIYSQELSIDLSEGDALDFWFSYPAEVIVGDVATASIKKVDGTDLMVRPSSDSSAEPYRITRIRRFSDLPIALKRDLGDTPPSITAFSIQGQGSRVEPGTVLSGNQMFLFSISNADNVDGNLTLSQDGTVIDSSIIPTDGSFSGTINTVTLNAGDSTTFILSGTDVHGNSFNRRFTIIGRQQAETLYYGISNTAIPGSIDYSAFTRQSVRSGTTFNARFTIPNTEYGVILSPGDLIINSIVEKTFNQEILNDFVKTEDAVTIGGHDYDVFTHQNNSGVTGTLDTTIKVG